MADSADFNVFKTVFFYSILILLLPIMAFFTTKMILFDAGLIATSSTTSNVCSAIVAVVVLHVALGMFIFKAYSDPDKSRVEKKDDKID